MFFLTYTSFSVQYLRLLSAAESGSHVRCLTKFSGACFSRFGCYYLPIRYSLEPFTLIILHGVELLCIVLFSHPNSTMLVNLFVVTLEEVESCLTCLLCANHAGGYACNIGGKYLSQNPFFLPSPSSYIFLVFQ